MTTATVAELARPARAKVRTRPTCAGLLREDLVSMLADALGVQWPDPRYWERPVAFAEEILGMRVWDAQARILEAYVAHKRVTVRSGHKIGKSCTAAIIALHFYCSKPDARVVFTSTTSRQVDAILWRELGKIRSKAGCCLSCREACARANRSEPRPCPHSSLIGGTMNSLARSGFRAPDFREVSGFTARDTEAVAGISGANLLYLPDEASGIEDAIFEAIEGNRAGGARIVMFSNPTRTEGEFYRSHTDKALRFEADGSPVLDPHGKPVGFYFAIQVSSEETPNVRERREVFPGLATWEWIEEKRAEWGEDSPLYKVRVRGEPVEHEDGKILTIHALTESEARWNTTKADGRLHVGLDPAGPGDAGDESAFAIRRGNKIVDVHVPRRGLDDDGHLVELLDVLSLHRKRREQVPVVTLDREGPIGASLFGHLRGYSARHPEAFVVVGVRASDRAARRPDIYDRMRDELWANLAEWVRLGGAIPENARLAKELHAPSWVGQLNGRLKATPKSELRKMLDGRSPDRADAAALSVWESSATQDDRPPRPDDSDPTSVDGATPYDDDRDPYGGAGPYARAA